MIAFEVNDMTCGHCVNTVTQAVKHADPRATVTVDLARHRVEVDGPGVDGSALRQAIEAAGYTPVPV